MSERILIVDDDRSIRYSLKRIFSERGFTVMEAKSGEEAVQTVEAEDIDLLLMDIRMTGMSGLDALKKIREIKPKQLVIIMTAFGTTETAIEAMKFGAFDYVLKPFDIPKLWELVTKALKVDRIQQETISVPPEACSLDEGECIIGSSPKMQEIYKLIGQVAPQDVTVLLRGESGTGKELIARAIYHHSRRANSPFLPVNCAAIPENLLESELFGHEKGAFTDAQAQRIGKFEQCDRGTIFLDEIGDMSLPIQAKLLRVLQERKITRLGSNTPINVDVRLIAATNKNLETLMKERLFREDLYYRLNVVSITIPPLRERKKDIADLAVYFLSRYARELGRTITGFSNEALERLQAYSWPGNIRELENTIKRLCILSKSDHILADELPVFAEGKKETGTDELIKEQQSLETVLDSLYRQLSSLSGTDKKQDMLTTVEKALIVNALKETKGNQLKAAKILGMNRNTLHNKIEKYRIAINKDVER
ncbi:MAG: sigma-54-dependent Fis family transcriptional regulator [Candidatus Omnitrophica bacterium]|nr:sigma-54-dependent Fis family transcriptional regulator [Candidatus Omnitrophota bacterium]